jgi:hypothetical protein
MNPKRAHLKGTAMLSRSGRVAELADAQDSGSCVRKDVGVQVPPRPHTRHVVRFTTFPLAVGPVVCPLA